MNDTDNNESYVDERIESEKTENIEISLNKGNELQGTNTVLMGASGVGKTHSIGTLVDTGIEVFYLSLENGLESLKGYYADKGKTIPSNLHWHRIKAKSASFDSLKDMAKKINTLDLKSLSNLSDPKRKNYDQMLSIYSALNDFTDDRTGISYGDVSTWGTDRALVIDGLSGINNAAMSLVVGAKPMKSIADWGIAQNQVYGLLSMLVDDCPCHFVLIAHITREVDEVLGGVKLMMSTLGKALAPTLPALFSDVILCTRDGTNWYWDTTNSQADVKTRNLPLSGKNRPDFKQIIDKWKARSIA